MNEATATWPLQGLSYFIARPSLWLRPILGTLMAFALILGLTLAALWWFWPELPPELGVWGQAWQYSKTVALALVIGFAGWLLLLPLIMSFAYESLAKRILRDHEVDCAGESVVAGTISAGAVLLRTLHWRLLWPVIWVLSLLFVPPLAPLLSLLGLAHIAAIDGCDLALALRGVAGRRRSRAISEHRGVFWQGVLLAALLGLLMGVTLIAWVLFLPMMFAGAALWVAQWQMPPEEGSLPADPDLLPSP